MESFVKGLLFFLLILVLVERLTRRREQRERPKRTGIPEPQVPPISVHGYTIPGSSMDHGCDPPVGHGTDSVCGGFGSGHHH